MKKAAIRRPGRVMLDMAIRELIKAGACPLYEKAIPDGFCSANVSCHDCWTAHLMWEEFHKFDNMEG